jgi:S-adenosylmethionine-diacylgycerolhomoserine-N-methlytransferase
MQIASDFKTLARLVLGGGKGKTHAESLEDFYHVQADSYDDFRKRLLHGRAELYRRLPVRRGDIWIDMGGGTGANLENLEGRLEQLQHVYLVDLCPSLLGVARRRIAQRGWSNVTAVEADITIFRPPEGKAQIITFSYSLTMVPEWEAAIRHAHQLLAPGGHLGVVDFYTTPPQWSLPLPCHTRWSRWFWPRWYAWAHVYLNDRHPTTLDGLFTTKLLKGHWGRTPYLMGLRSPYYQFIGCKEG